MWGEETPGWIAFKFCLVIGTQGVITCIKFGDDRLRGFWSAGCQSLPFPIDFDRRPYNSAMLPRALWYWRSVLWGSTFYSVSGHSEVDWFGFQGNNHNTTTTTTHHKNNNNNNNNNICLARIDLQWRISWYCCSSTIWMPSCHQPPPSEGIGLNLKAVKNSLEMCWTVKNASTW